MQRRTGSAAGTAMCGSTAHSGIRTARETVLAFRCQKTEKIPERAADVYRGYLHGCEKILALRSSVGRVRRSATRTESEER